MLPEELPLEALELLLLLAAWVDELEAFEVLDSAEDAGVWMNWAASGVGVGVGVEVGVGVGVDEELLELWQASGGAWPLSHLRVPSAMPLQTSSALICWPFS